MNTFFFVFFLLKHKHVMVEELLQAFIGEVDANLLESVELHVCFVVEEEIGFDVFGGRFMIYDGVGG